MPVPAHPKIYHIVHVDNLPSIIGDGWLWSDSIMSQRTDATVIGMGKIKRRRLALPVSCHADTHVADYVPFYFCPRSIMLYVIHRGNAPGLQYRGGQGPIIHLEADLRTVIQWADTEQRRWAFSLSNAGAEYAQFRSRREQLDEIKWTAVNSRDFRSADVKEGKQAEFLLYHSFPWHLVERVGVYSQRIAQRVSSAMQPSTHRPRVEIVEAWYY